MEQDLKGIGIGMDKSEVINELGKPQETKAIVIEYETYELWRYPIERKWANKFEAVGDYYYDILFLKDKVYRWDLIKAYAHPTYDYQEPDSSKADVTSITIIKE
jgi:hypothetical protein